jgi:threonine aldolase
LLRSCSNYQLLDHFHALTVGDPYRPWTVDDLAASPERLGAALLELPMREIGGQLLAWDQLNAIKAHCREQNIHLHMDGARLWETAAWYQRTYRDIAAGFDSAYVSFYKGIGGLGGAMLLGSEKFIAHARVWMQRQGGNVYRRSPYVIAAAMRFDERIAAMPAYFRRTEWLYDLLQAYPQWQVNPARPQANMLHLHFPVSRERMTALRDEFAQRHRIWLFGGARHAALPNHSYIEWYVGEALLKMPDERVQDILSLMAAGIAKDT